MIKYKIGSHRNIYLENGYKIYTGCIKIHAVQELHQAIEFAVEFDSEHGDHFFKTDPNERNVFEYFVCRDKFTGKPYEGWAHIDAPKVLLAGV